MNIEELRNYCLSLNACEEDFPFDETTIVFRVKGKIFCISDVVSFDLINVKCDPEQAIELREQYQAVVPGYHMNKKHWNSLVMDGSLTSQFVMNCVHQSYKLVVATLPKKVQQELE